MTFPSASGTREDRELAKALTGGVLSPEAKRALEAYGQHLEWCNGFHAWRDQTCDCGLTALLEKAP